VSVCLSVTACSRREICTMFNQSSLSFHVSLYIWGRCPQGYAKNNANARPKRWRDRNLGLPEASPFDRDYLENAKS